MTSVGFVGLGHMGGNMAERLLAAGYDVCGHQRQRANAQALEDAGLRWCDSPRAVAEAAEVVCTSLPDDEALSAAAEGSDGILAGLTAGTVWVDFSTVSPRISRELAAKTRELGAELLDSPVSGSVPQVQAGTLTIMVGGDEHAYTKIEPMLRELGTPTRVGENGQGLVLKLAINISLAVQMLAFAEGLRLAAGDGLNPSLAAGVMSASPIGSPMLKARLPLILDLPQAAWFDVRLMHKDIRLALDLGRELGIDLPSTGAVEDVLQQAEALGYGQRDIAALYAVLGANQSA